jgi:hypothetical protein
MNTQALLTDLTPEQEEKVSGGGWLDLVRAVIYSYKLGVFLGNQTWFFPNGAKIGGVQIISPGSRIKL